MSLALPLFLHLSAAFAPSVAPETLASFAQYESRLEPSAIHDNSTGETFLPATPLASAKFATALLAQGDNLDLGIMQVNSANLSRVGLTVATAFDPGQSIRAGAVILAEALLHGCAVWLGGLGQRRTVSLSLTRDAPCRSS